MAVSQHPDNELPRQRLLARGAGALSDAELLSVALGTREGSVAAADRAGGLLARGGGLRALLDREAEELRCLPGVGPATAARIVAVAELGRRHLAADLARGVPLTSPRASARYLQAELRRHPYEVFACLFLDNRHRVIRFERLFRGTIDAASVHPREVVRRAIALNAAAVILAHNHPSGVCEPSQADQALTRRLREALALVDVRVLDHFVVGDGEPCSLAEQGML